MAIIACILVPVIAIPLVILGVVIYGFAKGFLSHCWIPWLVNNMSLAINITLAANKEEEFEFLSHLCDSKYQPVRIRTLYKLHTHKQQLGQKLPQLFMICSSFD